MDSTVDARSGSISDRTVIAAGWLVAWRMVTRALGLVSTLILARILVPADFGLIAMATTFSASVGALAELGVSDALIRRQENERGHYDTAFTMQAIRGVLTGAVIAAGAWVASDWFSEPRLLPVMFVLAALAITSGLDNIGIIEFRRSLRFDMEFRLLFLPRIAGFCTTLAMAWMLRSFWALMIGITASQLMRLVMTYVVHPYRPRLTLSHWRDLVGFSFWTWATSLAILVWDRLDAFVLGPVLGPAKLGIYLIAAEIATMPITELIAPASSALFPGLSAAQQRGANPIGLAFSVTSAMLLIVVPLTVGVSATSGYVVAALLGPNWEAAQTPIAIFAWLCILSPFSWVCMTVLKATGAIRQYFVAIAAAAAFKALILYGVMQAGARLEVAAAAAVACSAVECGLFLWQLRGRGDTRWRESLGGLLRITASGVFVTGALVASGLGWQPVSMAALPALLVGGAIGFGAIVLFAAVQFALWWGAGCPEGPEHRILGLATKALTSLKPTNGPSRRLKPKAYVALYHSIDALAWKKQQEAGLANDESPYGFHHATKLGFDVLFAKDAPRPAGLASFITRLFGFDLLHAWSNRKRIAQADVIWTMTEGEGFAIAFLFALRVVRRKPIICNVVWLLNTWDQTLWYKKTLYRFLARYISVLTVHSEQCLLVAPRAFPSTCSELVYFGVNSDLLAPHPLRTAMPGEPLNIFSIGSDKTRDWKTLLAAFGNDRRFRLTLVCWRLSQRDVAEYDNVVLFPMRTMEEFVALYHAADIAVVPMFENIFSGITSALDAASVGVPVISSRTGGVPTYFAEDEVWYVPVGDHLAMREAAASSTAAERLARAEKAQRRFLERGYSSRHLARRYCDISERLLAVGNYSRSPSSRLLLAEGRP